MAEKVKKQRSQKSHTQQKTPRQKPYNEGVVASQPLITGFQLFSDGVDNGKITGIQYWTPQKFSMPSRSILKK